jgi:hypothetical protein
MESLAKIFSRKCCMVENYINIKLIFLLGEIDKPVFCQYAITFHC